MKGKAKGSEKVTRIHVMQTHRDAVIKARTKAEDKNTTKGTAEAEVEVVAGTEAVVEE